MSATLTIAVAQPMCWPADIVGNLARMQPLLATAARAGAQLVLFAEAGVTGYTPACPTVVVGDATCDRLHELARQHQLVIAAGFLERRGAARHIAHGVFFPDGRLVIQRKARPGPPEGSMPDWQPGPDAREIFEVAGVRCAISICADTGIPNLWANLRQQGVGLHLLPTGGCGPRGWGFTEASLADPAVFAEYLKKAATVVFSADAIRDCRQYGIALASCNQMADNGVDYFHPGHSMIVDRTGELVGLIPGSFVFEHLRERVVVGEIHANRTE